METPRHVKPDQPQVDPPLEISPTNWRITWFILAFATLSLASAVLPLWPDVQRFIPLEPLTRDGAVSVYGCFLVGFMLFIHPLIAKRPEAGRPGFEWLFSGLYVLTFAFVPLFVLAYIAGVHRDAVAGIILLAAVAHAFMSCVLASVPSRHLTAVMVVVFTVTILLPPFFDIRELVRGNVTTSPSHQPFILVLDMTKRFVPPPLRMLASIAIVLYLAAFVRSLGMRRRRVASLGIILLAATILAVAATPARPDVTIAPLTGDLMIPGRPWPLRVAAPAAGVRIEVAIAGRETFRWTSGADGDLEAWIFPVLHDAGETVDIVVDGQPRTDLALRPRVLETDSASAFVLVIDDTGELGIPAESPVSVRGALLRSSVAELPTIDAALGTIGVIVMKETHYENLAPAIQASLRRHVGGGAVLLLVDAAAESRRVFDEGREIRVTGRVWPSDLSVPVVAPLPLDANLYSNFELPDWGRIDLTGLIVFLLLYHVAFYLVFLVPLVLDAKKSLGVYATSVAFVLVLLVFGGWQMLKVIFLRETQILEQRIAVHVLARPDGGSNVRTFEIDCFASFNGVSDRLAFDAGRVPIIAHENRALGAGVIEVREGGRRLTIENPLLDRRRRKLAVKLSSVDDSPFVVRRDGNTISLGARPGVNDPLELLLHERHAAFVRRDGRIYPARLDGAAIRLGDVAAPTSWKGVIPEDSDPERSIAFARYLLGRYVPDRGPVLVILASGIRPLHDDPRYLARRDVLHLIVVPLAD